MMSALQLAKNQRSEFAGTSLSRSCTKLSENHVDCTGEAWQNRIRSASRSSQQASTASGRPFNPVGAWRSLVARLPWAQEVRGSNPRAPTN